MSASWQLLPSLRGLERCKAPKNDAKLKIVKTNPKKKEKFAKTVSAIFWLPAIFMGHPVS